MHIAISGNIGSGKTTLTKLLSKHYGWEMQKEEVDNNPYLFDFYKDMQRWSFNLQIFFLNSRFEQVSNIRKSGRDVIQDRTIYEDAHIFAPNLHAMGLMSSRDFENYHRLYRNMEKNVQAPDLMIYLRANVSTLVEQITSRGRDYETTISLDYLSKLNDRYEDWIDTYDKGKLLIVNVDNNNFPNDKEDLGQIISAIDSEIHGLFGDEIGSSETPQKKVAGRTAAAKKATKKTKAKA